MLYDAAARCRTITKSGSLAEVSVGVLAITSEAAKSVANKAIDHLVLETTLEATSQPNNLRGFQVTKSGALVSFAIEFNLVTV